MTKADVIDRNRVWNAPTLMLGAVVALLAFGMVMLTSASRARAAEQFGDQFYFVGRQAVWLALSLVATIIVARIDYRWYKKRAWLLLALSLIGLTLVFVPGIGIRRGGSSRWIGVGGMQFQPSELAKLTIVVCLSAWYAVRPWLKQGLIKGVLVPCAIIGTMSVLLYLEPDYGAIALIAAIGGGIMFVGGVKLIYLSFSALVGLAFFVLMVLHNPVRMGRVMAFIDPDNHPVVAYHLRQSMHAFSLGGLFGVGLGESIQKHKYLPEAHTDFIFAIIGEELGFLASATVVLLFLVVFVCGLRIAARAPDRFGRLLATGLVMALFLQSAVNIAVVVGCLPTKGFTLPFVSYGGSSLMVSMVAVGILVNIARNAVKHTRSVSDGGIVRGRELT